MSPIDGTHVLVRKLETIADLSPAEHRAIENLPAWRRKLRAGEIIAREGDRPDASTLVVSGWACRYKVTGAGGRQIVSFHLPGDIPDLQSLFLEVMDHTLAAVSPCEIAAIPHERLRELVRVFPNLGAAMWRDTLVDASTYREWMLGMGRRDAPEQMAHLFCELVTRLRAVGLVDAEESCEFPISQTDLADAMGMSAVHINRTLQDLRRQGLVSWSKGKLVVRRPDAIAQLAGFDPTYLHLQAQARRGQPRLRTARSG